MTTGLSTGESNERNGDGVPHVMTVLGAVDPTEIGFTLMHEHLLTRFAHATHRYDLAGMPEDDKYILGELRDFGLAGGGTLVDVTAVGINRQPSDLRSLSERTGVHVVMGCGWYRDHYYPDSAEIGRRTVSSLADELLGEIATGVGDTGIRPGIIGELGTEKEWMSPAEERVHRAAGRAAAASGLAVMTHSFASDIGSWQLDVLEEEGVPPSRVVIGHADSYRVREYHESLLQRGANIEFDTLAWYRPAIFDDALDLICEYIEQGFRSQLLISLDTCKAEHLRRFGGPGLTGVHDRIIPGLMSRGLTDSDCQALWHDNPRAVLTAADVTY